MCCDRFCVGVLMGAAVGLCLGVRLKTNEKKIRRCLHRAARGMEEAFDHMTA